MEQPVQSQTQQKIKIVFEVSGIGVFSDREPLTGDINPCTAEDKERMATVLTWEGSKAKIQIQNENGVAIDVKTIKPLSHFDPNVEYYYIDGAFVPTDINGLQTFVTYLNENIANPVTSEQQTYMKVIHDVVDKILKLPARPSESISAKIFDGKATIDPLHGEFGGYVYGQTYTNQPKCKAYLAALQNALSAAAPVNPPGGGGDAGGDAGGGGVLPPVPNPQPQPPVPNPQPQRPVPTPERHRKVPTDAIWYPEYQRWKAKTGTIYTVDGKVDNVSKFGGNRTRRHQHKKNRQTRRYNFQ